MLDGKKTIETRSYALPAKYIGIPIAIIETPGPLGKKQGIQDTQIVGLITFSECFKYSSRALWETDFLGLTFIIPANFILDLREQND